MLERITVNVDIHFGQPCIEGTRIPVHDVLNLSLKACHSTKS